MSTQSYGINFGLPEITIELANKARLPMTHTINGKRWTLVGMSNKYSDVKNMSIEADNGHRQIRIRRGMGFWGSYTS